MQNVIHSEELYIGLLNKIHLIAKHFLGKATQKVSFYYIHMSPSTTFLELFFNLDKMGRDVDIPKTTFGKCEGYNSA